jgi:uncharacterized membrane protein
VLQKATRAIGSAIPIGSVLWALLIVAAPWADALSATGPLPRWVAAGTYFAGSVVCHQRPDRSFHTRAAQWPVCARCSGLYLSVALGVAAALLAGPRRALRFAAWRPLLVVAAIPTAATLPLEWLNPAWSSTAARALAAVPLGAVVGWLLTTSMSFRVD